MVDSPEWLAAKAEGDSAELAVAEWFRSLDFETFKTLGRASFDLLLQATVEVKRDLKAVHTGNVAVEVSYNRQSSGIHTSPATYWAFVLNDVALLIRTPKLRDLIARSDFQERFGGDGGKSRFKLVPVEILKSADGVKQIPIVSNNRQQAKPPKRLNPSA